MLEPMMNDTVLDHVTSAAVIVYGLNLLKRLEWYQRWAAWVPMDDAYVHRIVSALLAFVTAIGIHVASQGDAATGWHLSITIPPLIVLLHAAWDWAQQFGLQQIIFDMLANAGQTATKADLDRIGRRVTDLPVSSKP